MARPGETTAAVEVAAPAKVNLYLHIVGRRSDGYHLLESLAAFTAFGDTLSAAPASVLSLKLEGPFGDALAQTPAQDNLVLRAASALASTSGVSSGASLVLTKRLPLASGIGGGSSDAAAALHALVKLWSLSIAGEALDRIGLSLGSDLPVCLAARAAFMAGIGDHIVPVAALPPASVVLVNPGVPLATPSVYRAFAAGQALRTSPPPRPLGPWRDAAALARDLSGTGNDLEPAAVSLCPAIAAARRALEDEGALLARMSGSGATCFGLFADPAQAHHAASAIARREPRWWCEATTLLP